jgi:hypothetical protein
MTANWGVIEECTDAGELVAYHVVPMVTPDPQGEAVMSAAHDLSDACPCHPNLEYGRYGWKIWNHHDADHPGSLESESSPSPHPHAPDK